MAKHLDGFTRAFADSRIPFMLAEVLTNGNGDMVDLVFRFVNRPAAALFGSTPEALKNLRFTRAYAADHLRELAPMAQVAFSGSAVSFPYATVLGKHLTFTCYQPMYGMVSCILEETGAAAGKNPAELLADNLPGGVAVLEIGSRGMRILSFNRGLCELAGFSRKEFFNRFAQNALPLIHPNDQHDLLQNLMDAARSSLSVNHDVRLVQKSGDVLWVNLRADILSGKGPSTTFYVMVLDIDQPYRERQALARVSRKAEELQIQYEALLDNLPGGYCVFHCGTGGAQLQPEWVSRGLCRMTGYPDGELRRRMGDNPLWLVHPDDRDATAAVVRSWHFEGSFHQILRIRPKGGSELWLSVNATACRLPDGQWRIYAACADVSEEQGRQSGQRFYSELAELLLENEYFIGLDYDPVRDVGQLELRDSEGRRTKRILPEYRKTLLTSTTVHSNDRKRVQTALRQALSRPMRATLEYLANYGADGYQWYRASYASLTDDQGNVYRIVGKAQNIHSRRMAKERFQAWVTRQKVLCGGVLCCVRLDLTANRLLDAKGSSRHLVRALFGNTADECLRNFSGSVLDGEAKDGQQAYFERDGLLDSFRQGTTHLELEHRLQVSEKYALWVLSTAELAENPENGHVEIFCRCVNVEETRRRAQLENALLAREFDFVLTIDVRTQRCHIHYGNPAFPEGDADFSALAEVYILARALPEDRELARSGAQLSAAIRHLKAEPCREFFFRLFGGENGPVRWEHCRFSWLDDHQETLLLTGRSIPWGPEEQ